MKHRKHALIPRIIAVMLGAAGCLSADPIGTFADGEAGSSIRTKLNAAIERLNSISGADGETYYLPVSVGDESGTTSAVKGEALDTALAALASGDAIALGPGTFTLSAGATLPTLAGITGAGKGTTIIDLQGAAITLASGVTIRGLTIVGGNLVGTDVDDVTLEQVEMDGTGMAAGTDLVSVTGGNSLRLVLRDCYLHGATQDNLRVSEACDVQIIGGTYVEATRDGISLEETGQHVSPDLNRSNSVVITGATIGRNGRYGIYSIADHDIRISACAIEYNDDSGLRMGAPIQPTVTGCIFEYNGTTAYTDAQILLNLSQLSTYGVTESNVTITGNTLASDSTNAHLIKLIGTHDSRYNIAITGNNFLDPSTFALTTAINCDTVKANYGFVITGNYFSGKGGVGDKGIGLGPSAGTITPVAVLIANNVFDDYGLYAMHIYGLVGVVIHGNLVKGNTHALYSNSGAGTFRLQSNVFRDSSGTVTNLTGSTATVVSIGNEGLDDDPDLQTTGFGASESIELTAGGEAVVTQDLSDFMAITALPVGGGAGSDNLDTITIADVTDGTLVLVTYTDSANITVTEAGNIDLGSGLTTYTLSEAADNLLLKYHSATASYVPVSSSSGTVVEDDTTPTLGGDLDAAGNDITDLGNVTFQTGASGGTLRTGASNADKFTLQAYDVNDSVYRTLIEADAGNDVRLQLPVDYLDLEDATDLTKIARLDSSGIATGTTRTFSFPDASGTFMLQLSDDATPSLGGDLAAGAFAINSADLTDVEILNFDAAETITISTGVATVTQTNVILAAEGAGTTDTVDSITRSGIQAGDVVILRADSGDTITIANGTAGGDNLDLGSDVVLDSTNETLTLQYNGTNWVIVATSPNLLTVEKTISETFTILEPDAVQGVSDDVILKKFVAEDYPNGVTINAIHIDASAAYTSETFLFEHWDDASGTTQTTVESIAASAISTEDDGTLSDATIPADYFLVVNLDDTPEDKAYVSITIQYTVD